MTTGQETTGQPPLYQSPQFQNEFPSLDGTGPSGSSGKGREAHHHHAGHHSQNAQLQQQQQQQHQNHQYSHSGGNSSGQGHSTGDGLQMSLRPQTEPSTWMQQQSGNRTGENNSSASSTQPAPDLHLPPVLKAVMPSFMTRGATGSGPMGFGLPSSSSTTSSTTISGGTGNSNFRQRQSGGGNAGERGSYAGNDHSPYQGRRSGNIPPRLQNQRQSQYDDHRQQQTPLIDTEAIVHRPIIRDEELERIESIAKDDGWAKHDPLDYNQKLQFSDDETFDSPPPKDKSSGKDDLRKDNKTDDDKRGTCKYH